MFIVITGLDGFEASTIAKELSKKSQNKQVQNALITIRLIKI